MGVENRATMRMQDSRAFSQKITLAIEVLGCRTLGELVRRVRAINPDSAVTLDRAYKWSQSRALPRDPSVYDDLARVLGLEESRDFVRTASVEAFADRIRSGQTPGQGASEGRSDGYPAVAGLAPGPDTEAGTAATPEPGHSDARWPVLLDGAYATYSLAWSTAHSGRVLRGCSHVRSDAGSGRRRIDYVEHNANGRLQFSGDLVVSRRLLSVTFDQEPDDTTLAMVLAVSTQATPVFGGLMVGQSIYAGAAKPICGRVLMVAVRDPSTDPEAGDGYFPADPQPIAHDLEGIGYGGADLNTVAGRILSYLHAPSTGLLEISHRAIEDILIPLFLTPPSPALSQPASATR